MKRLLSVVAVGFAVQYALGGVAGCSSADPEKKPTSVSGKNGTLSLALETVSASGKVYRLRDAQFFVNPSFFLEQIPPPFEGIPVFPDAGFGTGSAGLSNGAGGTSSIDLDGGFSTAGAFPGGAFGAGGFFETGGVVGIAGIGNGFGGIIGSPGTTSSFTLNSEDNPDDPTIERFVAPGEYNIDLFPGWFIEQVDGALGTSVQVPATLESSEFQSFDITSDQETFVRYDFLVDGSQVTFGSPGRLIVGIGITETNGSALCGDGVVEAGEQCDGMDLGGQTCSSVTMGSRPIGTLFCSGNCTLDATFCQGGFDGGTGGFGTGGFGTGGGSVGLPPSDAGVGPAAGGAGGKGPTP